MTSPTRPATAAALVLLLAVGAAGGSTRIYVGNLPSSASEEEIRGLFEPYGLVDSVELARDRATGASRGFGYVEMARAEAARCAITGLGTAELGGRRLRVQEAGPLHPAQDATAATSATGAPSSPPSASPELQEAAALHAHAARLLQEGQRSDAIEMIGRATGLASVSGQPSITAALLLGLGRALEGDPERVQDAVIAYEQGLKALAQDPELDLDEILWRLGGSEKAAGGRPTVVPDDLFQAAVVGRLEAAAADPLLHQKLLLGIGNAYLAQAQPRAALARFDLALGLPELAGQPVQRAHLLTSAAVALRRMDDLERAEARLSEALELFGASAHEVEARTAIATRASLQLAAGQPAEATESYRRAVTLYERACDGPGLARALIGQGQASLQGGDPAAAVGPFERGVELAQEADDGETLRLGWLGLGSAHRRLGSLGEARDYLERSRRQARILRDRLRTDEGKVAFFDSAAPIFDELLLVHLERAASDAGAWRDALEVSEDARGQALVDLLHPGPAPPRRSCPLLESKVDPTAPASAPDTRQMESATDSASRDTVAQASAGTRSPAAEPLLLPEEEPSNQDMRQMAVGTDSFRDVVQETAGTESPTAAGREAAETTRRPPALARLSFHVLEDRTVVFHVAADGAVTGHVAKIGRQQLVDWVTELRAALEIEARMRGVRAGRSWRPPGATPREGPETLLRGLHDRLLQPLAEPLDADDGDLAIIPDGPLWHVPFAALIDPEGEPLVERRPLLLGSSWSFLETTRRRQPPTDRAATRLLAVGNPDLSRSEIGASVEFEPLPWAEREAEAITEMHPGPATLLLGGEAAGTAVTEALSQADVIHLATHGLADDADPLSSFVILAADECSDGRLTARQVIRDLRVPADLVVLSACQTGLGQITGDGTVGLSRSFLAAGARSVIVSLWSIDDRATGELMRSFYRSYFAGESKTRALRSAMVAMRSDPERDSAAYWAPFFLIGAED